MSARVGGIRYAYSILRQRFLTLSGTMTTPMRSFTHDADATTRNGKKRTRTQQAYTALPSPSLPSLTPPPLDRRRSGRIASASSSSHIYAPNKNPFQQTNRNETEEMEDEEQERKHTPSSSTSPLPPPPPPAPVDLSRTDSLSSLAASVDRVDLTRKRSATKKSSSSSSRSSSSTQTYAPSLYTPQSLVSSYWVGCHVSASGGVSRALENAGLIGARAVAFDLKSKRTWSSTPMSEDEIQRFHNKMKEYHFSSSQILPHGSYLQNIGAPNSEVYEKSKLNLLDELRRCHQLGLTRWNFHPGSATGGVITKEACMEKIAATLNWSHRETSDSSDSQQGGVMTVLENMAGQGNVIGAKFEELKYIIDRIDDKRRVGVCIDTCHAFAAGYDLRTSESLLHMLNEFDRIVGLNYLVGLHLNDSQGELGCRRDRHASIGAGCIGLEGFRALMNTPILKGIPMILETPCKEGERWIEKYSTEIGLLYSLEKDALKDERPNRYHYIEEETTTSIATSSAAAAAASKKKKKKNTNNVVDMGVDSECDDGDDIAPATSKKQHPSNTRMKKNAELDDEEDGKNDIDTTPTPPTKKRQIRKSKSNQLDEQQKNDKM